MVETHLDLNYRDIMKMSDEVGAPDGPGSSSWDGEGVHTKRVNDAVMVGLRQNQGKLAGDLDGLALLILTTTGAKSGQRRPIPLVYQILDDRLLVVASMGGSTRNPPWLYNLMQNPAATVELNGETFQVRAVIATGQDRDDLFRRVAEKIPQWAKYQASTQREIPVVELERL